MWWIGRDDTAQSMCATTRAVKSPQPQASVHARRENAVLVGENRRRQPERRRQLGARHAKELWRRQQPEASVGQVGREREGYGRTASLREAAAERLSRRERPHRVDAGHRRVSPALELRNAPKCLARTRRRPDGTRLATLPRRLALARTRLWLWRRRRDWPSPLACITLGHLPERGHPFRPDQADGPAKGERRRESGESGHLERDS